MNTFVSFLLHTQPTSSQSYIPPSAHKSKATPYLVFYLDSNTKAIHTSTSHTSPTPPTTTTMSSYNYTSSYSSYTPQKGASYSYSRPSTSSTSKGPCPSSPKSILSNTHPAYSSTSTSSSSYSASSSTYQSLYTQSASSSRSKRYSKPPVIHNGGGKINDPNTSTSAPNGGYYN